MMKKKAKEPLRGSEGKDEKKDEEEAEEPLGGQG